MQQTADPDGPGRAVFAAQSTFRRMMDVVARPGSIRCLSAVEEGPAPLSSSAALALALFDHDTAIWLDPSLRASAAVADWLRFQTGCVIIDEPARSAFALASSARDLPRLDAFAPGSLDYPDRSTTLILQVPSLTAGPALALSGPGIRGTAVLRAAGLPEDFVAQNEVNRALFPCGIDILLIAGDEIAALPRTVAVARA